MIAEEDADIDTDLPGEHVRPWVGGLVPRSADAIPTGCHAIVGHC